MENLNLMNVQALKQIESKKLFGGNLLDYYGVAEILWSLAGLAYKVGAANNPGANGYMGCKL